MTTEDFIREAIKEARVAKASGEWPFGVVIVLDGKVIARGRCTESATKNVLGHDGLQVVGMACSVLGRNDLSDCEIYGTNEPCLMCASAIIQAKISKIVFAVSRADMPHLLRERKLSINDLISDAGYGIDIQRGVLKDEVLALFADIKK